MFLSPKSRSALVVVLCLCVASACDPGALATPRDASGSDAGRAGDAAAPNPDGTVPLPDASAADAGMDSGTRDGGRDAGEVDGGPEDSGLPDGGPPPCSDPPGSACNPIVIDGFPFSHSGNTSLSSEDALSRYACAPGTDESGPEVHYELRLSAPMRVTFELTESSGVDTDIHVLRAPNEASCISRANTTLEQPLGAGTWRVVVDTFHSGTDRSGAYVLDVSTASPSPRALGTMWNTYYYLADEDEYTGARDTPIYDAACNEITRVRSDFSDAACIEGSGLLVDDRVVNYATTCTSSCTAAPRCGSASYRICYSVLDADRYPFGQGAGSRALVPDESMAVDPDFVALGTWVYFAELDGLLPPGGGPAHSGCLRADDVGGAIDGNHFDFFSGTRGRWLSWETLLPTRSTLTATADDPRCFPTP